MTNQETKAMLKGRTAIITGSTIGTAEALACAGADLSKPAEVRRTVMQTTAELGAVDILVNNAGIQHVGPIGEFPTKSGTRSARAWC